MAELHSGTQAIDRASSLLIHILESQTPPLLTELARIYGLPKSTTSRILSALERRIDGNADPWLETYRF